MVFYRYYILGLLLKWGPRSPMYNKSYKSYFGYVKRCDDTKMLHNICIFFYQDDTYTIMMVDPDVTSYTLPTVWAHWVVTDVSVNINRDTQTHTLTQKKNPPLVPLLVPYIYFGNMF